MAAPFVFSFFRDPGYVELTTCFNGHDGAVAESYLMWLFAFLRWYFFATVPTTRKLNLARVLEDEDAAIATL